MNAPFVPPIAALQTLALRVADHGRSLGLTLVSLRASRVRRSASHNLVFRDRQRRVWLVRLSDHQRPAATGYELPHFDLVTDGRRHAKRAFNFLGRVAAGEEPWTEPVVTRVRKGQTYWQGGRR